MARSETLKQFYKDTPEMISGAVEMKRANTPIQIYKGNFLLKHDELEIKMNGKIYFEWFPNQVVKFSGKAKVSNMDLVVAFNSFITFQLIINHMNFGDCYLSNFSLGSTQTNLGGTLRNQAVLGDKSVVVNVVKFSIPNLSEYHGEPVKKTIGSNISSTRGRMFFTNDQCEIIIDKCRHYDVLQNSLNTKGGFIIQYLGELKKKKGDLSFEKCKEILDCFDMFISFINGRRTSAIFAQGLFNNKNMWSDFTGHYVDNYKYAMSWLPNENVKELNKLWQVFSKLWQDKHSRHFLESVVHWYTMANTNKGLAEGAIIMAQTALELIYNWLLVNQNKLLVGNDAQNISASNKIRLLLSYLNVTTSIPASLKILKSFPDTVDAPDALVQIRNSIVHTQEVKRKKLKSVDPKIYFEALQLAIWYIELSLLKILQYNDRYYNRTIREGHLIKSIELVPWYDTMSK